jgi:hypothetical protein
MLDRPKKDWNALMIEQTKKTDAEDKEKELGREAKRHKDARPSLALPEYAGTYKHAGYGTAEIISGDSGLVLRWSNFAPKLTHFHFDTSDAKEDGPLRNTPVQFLLGPNGEVSGLRMLDQEFRKQPAVRTATAASGN